MKEGFFVNVVLETIRNRRSVRKYLPGQIKEVELQAILEAGAFAPSAHNDQPWHFTVIQKKELLDELSRKTIALMAQSPLEWVRKMAAREGYHLFYNAPTVIVVSGRDDAMSPLVDCSAAIQNMLLAAEAVGVGSCWIGLVRHLFAKREELGALQLPSAYTPYYAVSFGYPDPSVPLVAPARREGTVTYIR